MSDLVKKWFLGAILVRVNDTKENGIIHELSIDGWAESANVSIEYLTTLMNDIKSEYGHLVQVNHCTWITSLDKGV